MATKKNKSGFLKALISKEKALEGKGKKTKKEAGLEKLISRIGGKKYKGKR